LSTAWVAPGLIGPALAGAIAEQAGWRWVFLGLVPLSAVAVALAVRAVRRLGPSPAPAAQESGTRPAAALAVGTAALLAAPGLDSSPVALAVAAAAAAVVVASLSRLTPAGTLRASPGLPAAVAGMGL